MKRDSRRLKRYSCEFHRFTIWIPFLIVSLDLQHRLEGRSGSMRAHRPAWDIERQFSLKSTGPFLVGDFKSFGFAVTQSLSIADSTF